MGIPMAPPFQAAAIHTKAASNSSGRNNNKENPGLPVENKISPVTDRFSWWILPVGNPAKTGYTVPHAAAGFLSPAQFVKTGRHIFLAEGHFPHGIGGSVRRKHGIDFQLFPKDCF